MRLSPPCERSFRWLTDHWYPRASQKSRSPQGVHLPRSLTHTRATVASSGLVVAGALAFFGFDEANVVPLNLPLAFNSARRSSEIRFIDPPAHRKAPEQRRIRVRQ